MIKFLDNKYLVLISRILLGLIFVIASIHKILYPEEFAYTIYKYNILPLIFINFLSIFLPMVELISGILLIFGIFKEASLTIITSLLLVFIGALTFNYMRGLNVDCGCFTPSHGSGESLLIAIFRDIFFLFLAFILFNSYFKSKN